MKACGIVVEYNPFHNGHIYHVQQARTQSKSDVVIAVMSGNFLQRGEPAVIDKWQRAEAALLNGVDLVVELPIEWALQPADYFAKGSIAILQALGCESLCFGTDYDSTFDYQSYGQQMLIEKETIDALFKKLENQNQTYAEKMQLVMNQIFPEMGQQQANQPNHVLGLSYSQENATYERPMRLLPIKRLAQGYHSKSLEQEIASATAIREGLLKHAVIDHTVPQATLESLTHYHVFWQDFWPLLKYQLLVRSLTDLKQIYQMSEGLEHRLKRSAQTANDFKQFIQQIKTKRYTQTRLQRLCCYVLLGITNENMQTAWEQPIIHVLGFTEQGKNYLNQVKESVNLPIVSKIGKNEAKRWALNLTSDQIYQLAHPVIQEQNFGRFPIQIKNR